MYRVGYNIHGAKGEKMETKIYAYIIIIIYHMRVSVCNGVTLKKENR